MKIMILNMLYPPHRIGGAEKSVAFLAEALARSGDEVVVVTLDDIASATVTVENGVTVHRLPLDNSYWPFGNLDASRSALRRLRWHWRNRWNARSAKRIGELLDRERPDVVHSHVLTGFSVAAWSEIRRRGIPLVHTLRDYAVICTRSSLFKNGRACAQRCIECKVLTRPGKAASRQVDQLVSNSDYVIGEHQRAGYFRGVPARRIFNIVPLTPRVRPQRAVSDPLVFGFIGRVEAEKGIEVVLKACEGLQREDWRLRVAGVGVTSYVDALRARYRDPRIEWVGYTDSEAFYGSIDVLLMPSVWPEPLPRTLIEALAHGLSAICAEAGGIPEIAELPRLSLTYAPTDFRALRQAMMTALADAANWRAGGLKQPGSLAVFSEEAVVAQNRAAYADAIAGVDRP